MTAIPHPKCTIALRTVFWSNSPTGKLISDRKAEELIEARLKKDRTDVPEVIEIHLNEGQRAIVERLNEKER